jgi:glycerol kinase
MKDHILALDQGTTSCRAILIDKRGAIRCMAQREFTQFYPQPGWVEHDASEIWATQFGVIAEVLASTGVDYSRVAGIGITNQRETTILWDRTSGRPISRAIVWQDRRTSALCDELKAEGAAEIVQEKTGLVLDAYFSATKIQWLLDHVPGARAEAARGNLAFGTVDSWLIWKLTGGAVHATDASNASRTLLYNIHKHDWDDTLLELFNVPRAVLPAVQDSSGLIGETAAGLFPCRIPVSGVAGDQQAALFGQLCLRKGMLKHTYGTGGFMVLNTGAVPVRSANNLLTTVAWRIGGETTYALEGSIFIAGAVVQWLRDGLGLIRQSADVEALARGAEDNGGVYFVPAFTGLGAPHWDQDARGLIIGLTRGSTAAHLARAALESIAFQTADVLEAMEADTGYKIEQLRVDGGATANDMLMQFQADLLGAPVVRPSIRETTALGAGYLAGLGVGLWGGVGELESCWQADKVFDPSPEAGALEGKKRLWRRAVERSKGWA